jgi:hypothetical protein
MRDEVAAQEADDAFAQRFAFLAAQPWQLASELRDVLDVLKQLLVLLAKRFGSDAPGDGSVLVHDAPATSRP